MRLKVETNTREHFALYGLLKAPFKVASRWFEGTCDIQTYELDELLGTKRHAEQAFARHLLGELRFEPRNQLATLAVDLVLRLEQRSTTGIALGFERLHSLLGCELFLECHRDPSRLAGLLDLAVEFFNLPLQPQLQVVGSAI